MASFEFVCSECGTRFAEGDVRYVCPACATEQVPNGPIRGVLDVVLAEVPRRWPERSFADPEVLTAWLPVASASTLPPLGVGGTPLLPVPRLRRALGLPNLWVKDDTRNPSGSTKDRASLLVVAKALEYRRSTVACASTGNAATALAAIGAAAGLAVVVILPASAPAAKQAQIAAYGALLVPIQASYDAAFELSLVCCERFGWYNRNTAYNPFTIEGKKTAALEIAAALQPETPDVLVVPAGDGVIVAGLSKGFADLVLAGLLPRPPRLLVVQPEGAGSIVRALRDGLDGVAAVPGAHSLADSLVVETPRNGIMALRRVRASGGAGVAVTDAQILEAIARLAAQTGVFAEPAAAAALAGLEQALAVGLVGRDERVVLMVTGSGLKDPQAVARAAPLPTPVAATLEAVEASLAGRLPPRDDVGGRRGPLS
jgi:threonine synthase